ncbi:MAG: methionine aminopeptidase type [Armatimonadetes bacterium]|jgi:methionyl aminopeptidase|nr:methionine aminopeptidase type [Armatimonadota bacterium]
MSIESVQDLEGITRSGEVVRLILNAMRDALLPGITTAELDAVGAAVMEEHGAVSAPRRDYGFPGVNLISVNDEAVHGIPGPRVIRAGDLVKLDVTTSLDGYIADAALTVAVPPSSDLQRRLCACAERAFRQAAAVARDGVRVREVGRAVETEVRRCGFRVLKELSGHGVGRQIHEEPSIPNYYHPSFRGLLREGMVLTIEPIISVRSERTVTDRDGWTMRTTDGSLAAHYEHTLLITRGAPVLLTA